MNMQHGGGSKHKNKINKTGMSAKTTLMSKNFKRKNYTRLREPEVCRLRYKTD